MSEPVCGTRAAYLQHRKRGEVPCAQCRRANADYIAQRRTDKSKRAEEVRRKYARERALARLQAMHPVHYRALYAEELGDE